MDHSDPDPNPWAHVLVWTWSCLAAVDLSSDLDPSCPPGPALFCMLGAVALHLLPNLEAPAPLALMPLLPCCSTTQLKGKSLEQEASGFT